MRTIGVVCIAIELLLWTGCSRKPKATKADSVSITESSKSLKSDIKKSPRDTIPSIIDSNCHISGPVIRQVQDREGYVAYRGDLPLYCIVYTPPYSTDVVTIGYVCNMPDRYKRANLKVKFSGKYYHAYKYVKTSDAGETLLFLYLDAIEML